MTSSETEEAGNVFFLIFIHIGRKLLHTWLSSAKGFRLSRYPQKHSFVHVVADKQDLKLDVESFLCIGLVKKLSSWFFLHSEWSSKVVEGLGKNNSRSWLKTEASNWSLRGLVIEKSNLRFWMISWSAENTSFCYLNITKPCRWKMEKKIIWFGKKP